MTPTRQPTRRVAGFDLHFSDEEARSIVGSLTQIIQTGFISMGPNVAEFERLWADYCGLKYAVGTANGTCSLEIILRALDVRGKTVIVPSHTFIATPVAAILAGAKVIFVDCQRENLQMDPADLQRKIRDDTAAVVLVHMSGIISPHLDAIRDLCDERGIALIEDAAHAHGATIDGRKAGSLGAAASFSFFSTKVLTTGEGGMVVTNEQKIYETALALRDHGRFTKEPNLHDDFGNNWRPSELHAAIGVAQMRRADAILERRRAIARRYDEQLTARNIPGVTLIKIPSNIHSAYYKYIVYLAPTLPREELKRKLKEDYGVSLGGDLYNRPCHSQPLFVRYPDTVISYPDESYTETNYVVAHHACLPLYVELTDDQVDYVVDSLHKTVVAMSSP